MILAPGQVQWTYVEFHNAGTSDRSVDLEFDLSGLPGAFEVTVQITALGAPAVVETVTRSRPATAAEQDQVRGEHRLPLARLLCWLRWLVWWLVRRFLGRDMTSILCAPTSAVPVLDDTVHEGRPGTIMRFRDVDSRRDRPVGAVLRFTYQGGLPAGASYRLDVRQVASGEVLGGSEYVLGTAPDPAESDGLVEAHFDVPGGGDGTKFVPGSAAHQVLRDGEA